MSTRLAGSRALDERRRRRMSVGDEDIDIVSSLPTTAAKPSRGGQARSMWRASALHFPLRKAISRRLWKIWGVGSIGLLVAAGLIAASFYADQYASLLGPGFSHLFNLADGRAIRLYGVVATLLTGQLSVFVWWARSRSSKDFRRRYRVWSRFAGACFAVSFLIGTDAHIALNATILWLSKREPIPHGPWTWIAPTGVCMLAFLLLLHRDMRECRASLAMLWLAALSWAAAGAMIAAGEIPGNPFVIAMIQSGTVLFGHWCLLMTLLLHARHVVYNSAEPPTVLPATESKWRFPFFRSRKTAGEGEETGSKRNKRQSAAPAETKTKPRQSAKADAASNTKASTAAAAKSAPQAAAKTSAPVAAKPNPPTISKPSATPAQPVKAAIAAPSRPAEQSRPMSQAQTLRIDEPEEESPAFDKNSLKGLSKRERRMLRKKWRDEQRGGSGGDSDDDDDED